MQTNLTRMLRPPEPTATWLVGLTRQLQSTLWKSLPDTVRSKVAARERLQEPPTVTLLVTDLVDFSGLVAKLGDRAARDLIQSHNRVLRNCLRLHGGREVAHTGDGLIASFARAAAAVRCGLSIQERLRTLREQHGKSLLHARIGLHAGKPLPEEERLFGAAVIVAVRVCDVAPADAVFVSDVVRELAGDGFEFEERGFFYLKGFSEPYRLCRVDDQSVCAE